MKNKLTAKGIERATAEFNRAAKHYSDLSEMFLSLPTAHMQHRSDTLSPAATRLIKACKTFTDNGLDTPRDNRYQLEDATEVLAKK